MPFLNFCYLANYPGSSPESSPAKKYDTLRPFFLEATAILICGLNKVKAVKVDITHVSKSLGYGLFTPTVFIGNYSALLDCVKYMEECVNYSNKSDVDQFHAIFANLNAIVVELAKDLINNSVKSYQDPVGRFLDFSIELCRLTNTRYDFKYDFKKKTLFFHKHFKRKFN